MFFILSESQGIKEVIFLIKSPRMWRLLLGHRSWPVNYMKETGVLNFVDTILAFSLDNWDTHFRPSEIQSLFIRNKWLSVQSFSMINSVTRIRRHFSSVTFSLPICKPCYQGTEKGVLNNFHGKAHFFLLVIWSDQGLAHQITRICICKEEQVWPVLGL